MISLLNVMLCGCAEYNRLATVSETSSLSNIVQLTDSFNRAGEARFETDMRWIVFRAVAKGGQPSQLFVTKLNAERDVISGIQRPICITPADARSLSGSFSPDGLSLIFISDAGVATDPENQKKQPRIFRVDGWEGAIAMADAAVGINLAQHPLETDFTGNQSCSYSPDGKWICSCAGEKDASTLFIIHPDGTHRVQIASPDEQPAFSRDCKTLVYCSRRGGGPNLQIFTADLVFSREGEVTGLTNERQLTNDENININPAFHPDGKHIVYSTSKHGRDNYELYVMDLMGKHKTRITFSPGADLLPEFSPDGNYLMWTSQRSKDGTDQVFIAKFQFPRGS